MSKAFDFVFTSGGIGPTHDDLTMDGVARAFGRALVQSDSIAGRIERAQGKPPNESQLKMAMVPEGASLIDAGDLWFPVVVVENVYIFPGVPELLVKKFLSVRDRFRGEPFLLKNVYVKRRESDIAASLNELLREFPELLLGSYPKFDEDGSHVLLTLESRDAGYLGRALDSLLGAAHRRRGLQGRVAGPHRLRSGRVLARARPSRLDARSRSAWRPPRCGAASRCAPRAGCGRPPPPGERPRHLRLAKTAVALVCIGFTLGPLSAVFLRGFEPLRLRTRLARARRDRALRRDRARRPRARARRRSAPPRRARDAGALRRRPRGAPRSARASCCCRSGVAKGVGRDGPQLTKLTPPGAVPKATARGWS